MLIAPLEMATFFTSIYNQLLVPPMLALGIVLFAFAAVRFFIGQREGAEHMARVALGLFFVAFAPTIVTMLWAALTSAGGGVAK
ncbi:MAG TPA: hypothetical protein VFL91_14320 [Thermomicrobiales bacterium]|nr:hypothetical protein [Thermomicrobiales bacterium]